MENYLGLIYFICGALFCILDWNSTIVNKEPVKDQYRQYQKLHKEQPFNPEYRHGNSGILIYWVLLACFWPFFSIPYIDALYKKFIKKEGIW